MNKISFRGTPIENRSLKAACQKMASPFFNQEYILLKPDRSLDKAYITNKYDGRKAVVRLNITSPRGNASTVLTSGTKNECASFFGKDTSLNYVIDVYDRLKYLLRRDV